jgi:hypothetical protein
MHLNRLNVGIAAVVTLAIGGVAIADDAAPAKPSFPSVSEILDASGLTLTGYVDGTFAQQRNDTKGKDYDTFALQQAAFTLSKLPTAGFGALVNVVAGQNPYSATGFGRRSILFSFEPVTNSGVRVSYAANDKLNLILGVNNGWTKSQDTADGTDRTLEAGLAYTPSKALAWTLQGYYGRDNSNYADIKTGYLTKNFDADYAGSDQKLKEITLTFAYDPRSETVRSSSAI